MELGVGNVTPESLITKNQSFLWCPWLNLFSLLEAGVFKIRL